MDEELIHPISSGRMNEWRIPEESFETAPVITATAKPFKTDRLPMLHDVNFNVQKIKYITVGTRYRDPRDWGRRRMERFR